MEALFNLKQVQIPTQDETGYTYVGENGIDYRNTVTEKVSLNGVPLQLLYCNSKTKELDLSFQNFTVRLQFIGYKSRNHFTWSSLESVLINSDLLENLKKLKIESPEEKNLPIISVLFIVNQLIKELEPKLEDSVLNSIYTVLQDTIYPSVVRYVSPDVRFLQMNRSLDQIPEPYHPDLDLKKNTYLVYKNQYQVIPKQDFLGLSLDYLISTIIKRKETLNDPTETRFFKILGEYEVECFTGVDLYFTDIVVESSKSWKLKHYLSIDFGSNSIRYHLVKPFNATYVGFRNYVEKSNPPHLKEIQLLGYQSGNLKYREEEDRFSMEMTDSTCIKVLDAVQDLIIENFQDFKYDDLFTKFRNLYLDKR